MGKQSAPNVLKDSGLPVAFAIAPDPSGPISRPRNGRGIGVRTSVRSLTVMQKEAIIATTRSAVAWRLSSDEGPYLDGHDHAPAPLAFLTAGLAADLMNSIRRSLRQRTFTSGSFQLTLETFFSMEGSLLRGSMVGGALDPNVAVKVDCKDPDDLVFADILRGIAAAPSTGLVTGAPGSQFALGYHGQQIPLGRALPTHDVLLPDPGTAWASPAPSPGPWPRLVEKIGQVGDSPPDAGTSLTPEQSRGLHLRALAALDEDGLTRIDVWVLKPNGSTFRFMSEEPDVSSGFSRAPEALTLISAGLAFCFMTQIGRFAAIVKESLGPYHVVQDTRFIDNGTGGHGLAEAPATHVYLAPTGDADFARHALDMSEQTCFLHALCRTPLDYRVRFQNLVN